MTAGQVMSGLFRAWLYGSMAYAFSVLMLDVSGGARLNLFDVLVTIPALFVLTPLMVRREFMGKAFLLVTAPLALFILLALVSLVWADSPNASRTFRAALQVCGLFALFSYLYFTGHSRSLEKALFFSCVVVAVICAWHLITMYLILDLPWGNVLYQGADLPRLQSLGIKPINAMHATLIIAPQAAMLLGLILCSGEKRDQLIGGLALIVMLVFLVSLERRTGQVAILVALIACAVLYRRPVWYLLIGAVVLCAGAILMVSPEFFLSRGLSWRPAIWMTTLDLILNAPFFGHGITNTVIPVAVQEHGSGVATFRHPHNMPLAVAYFTGLSGLILWLLIWTPGAIQKATTRVSALRDGYMLLPMFVGLSVLMFDGENPLSPLHYDWFCFWIPAMLILSSYAVRVQRAASGDSSLPTNSSPEFANLGKE